MYSAPSSGGASLDSAVAMYEDSTRPDTLLRDKHWQLCWAAIQRAIRQRRESLDYEVPAFVYGPYPVYRRDAMVAYLLRECRQQRFTVELLDPTGGVIRISGWAERARSKAEQDRQFERDFQLVPTREAASVAGMGEQVLHVPKSAGRGAAATQSPVLQVGSLSARMKQVVAARKKI
ncbi:MAG: hypothetical protein KGL42_13620 [Betaproteobacteria bacterium]|nr:hypothetical protein [Betaproteobacteria bacterium]